MDNIDGRRLKRTLRHAKNKNHILVTSLTVYGEIIQVCFRDNRSDDLHDMLDLIGGLDIQCWLPNPQLRDCCKCLDKQCKRCGKKNNISNKLVSPEQLRNIL
jgi:hypothetical protein